MDATAIGDHPALREMVELLREAAGDALDSVVLYGSAARGDWHERTSDLNLLVVLRTLEPATLERLRRPWRRWSFRGQPPPRLFSPATLATSADIFPIELLDILEHHVTLLGADPLAGLAVSREHLRLQCERELREKLMHLVEAYVDVHARPRELVRLLTGSYTTFLALFRACLRLTGGPAPAHNGDVVEAFCRMAGVDARPFREVDALKRGARCAEPRELFARYHAELGRAVEAVDRFRAGTEGAAP